MPAFLDELRARTPLAAVVGRRVKLARSGRQWKGCCPFHGEKSPSFYVYDDHFHCFGCGAHGDAISFVMQSEGAGFNEAVEQLASEAGLDVPKPTPVAAAAERRRLDLYDVLEAACRLFKTWLYEPGGRAALDYLRGRGLSDFTIERFGLGWSGEGRGALAEALGGADISKAMLIEAGLMRQSDTGRPAQDLFYNRVMFPIRDRRGRVISFGGRILGAGQPKYVNGPETDLFSKRRTLYGLDFAREGARKGAKVLAVEGYLDVISLHQAGLDGAVAPLGTALTDEQLKELWRLSPAPILCFDGDAAGARAAARAAALALPNLTAERTLHIASLPAGDDPDTLIRREGASGMQAVVGTVRPLADTLFDLLNESSGGATPEQRASFRKRLDDAANSIKDKALASEYRRRLLDLFYAERQSKWQSSSKKPAKYVFTRPTPTLRAAADEMLRTLLAILLRHPELLHDVEEAFGGLELPENLDRLRTGLMHFSDHSHEIGSARLDSASLIDHLAQSGLATEVAQALSAVPYPLPACAEPGAMPAEAETGWWHFYGMMHRGRLEEEVAAAMRDVNQHADEASQRRLVALCTARNALQQGEQGAELDT